MAVLVMVSIVSGSALTLRPKESEAVICTPCVFCFILDPLAAVLLLDLIQENIGSPLIEDSIEKHLNSEENWIVEEFFEEFWLRGLQELTHFLSAFAMYQLEMVGAFFDARHYLETQRLHFELQAEAHRDYHPSDDFCWFGTGARSLSSTDGRVNFNFLAMSERSIARQLEHKNSLSAGGVDNDKTYRWNQFVDTYCDPKDNNWSIAGTGLDLACDRDGYDPSTLSGALDRGRVNRDIDYTRLIDEPRTLDVDFTDSLVVPFLVPTATADEEDVLAMGLNLYGNDALSHRISNSSLSLSTARKLYMDLRSVVAKRNVAENSYNAIVSLKSAGTNGDPAAPVHPDVGLYMAAIMKDLMPAGTPDAEIFAMLGNNPSYYAQLEVLGKKIYQNPDFFANLYDKPANVKRKAVAMKAIDLMLDRALFESELRQEMILSVLLSSELSSDFGLVNNAMTQSQKEE